MLVKVDLIGIFALVVRVLETREAYASYMQKRQLHHNCIYQRENGEN